jgi:hypothetical protein
MSKLMKFFASISLVASLLAFAPSNAEARWAGGWHGGGWHGSGWRGGWGGWRGGGWGWGPAFAVGFAPAFLGLALLVIPALPAGSLEHQKLALEILHPIQVD